MISRICSKSGLCGGQNVLFSPDHARGEAFLRVW
jgi:hypothetical protein